MIKTFSLPLATEKMLEKLPILPEGTCLDPYAWRTDGAIVDVLKEYCPHLQVKGNQNIITRESTAFYWGALLGDYPLDWIITAPPFSSFDEGFLEKAYRRVHKGMIILARVTILEPVRSRRQWLAHYNPKSLWMLKRVKYSDTDRKIDSNPQKYAWIFWLKSQSDFYLPPFQFLY